MQKDNTIENNVEEQFVAEDTVQNADSQPKQNISVKKRFEVEIYDKISVGEPPYDKITLEKVHFEKPVVIEAASKKDLQDFAEKLSLCNQTFKIVKVLDDVQIATPQIVKAPNNSSNQLNKQTNIQVQQDVVKVEKRKPKFYKIGNIEIKDDNGKIYQKQWLKLTDDEMSNFRIVSNKNNAIVNLKDKSIEMKRWVLVENTEEDASSSLEKEFLNEEV